MHKAPASRLWFLFVLIAIVPRAYGFPETIREGYFNCGACHKSVNGGGLLTQYGRELSEDFMSTWSKEGEGAFLNGAIDLPKSLQVGGDVRFLSLLQDNGITKTQSGFPMQAELELGYQVLEKLEVVAATGVFSGEADIRRAYLKYRVDDHWGLRAGKFYPGFGIQSPDHSLLSRKLLGFDERQENFNAELSYAGQAFQAVAGVMLGGEGEGGQVREKGFNLKASILTMKTWSFGLSYLQGKGAVWDREAVGPYALIGITPRASLLSEIYFQNKKAIESDDPSTPNHRELISSTRLGFDFWKGFQVFEIFESADNLKGDYTPRQRAYGAGIQWIPRPHYELYGKLVKRIDEAFSKDQGYQGMLVSHYWF